MMRMRHKKGFTLIEMILAFVLGVILMTATTIIFYELDNWALLKSRKTEMSDVEFAILRTLREFQRVNGTASITTFASDDLQFSDINANTIRFHKSGSDYMRNDDVLLGNVTALTFEYRDANGAAVGAVGSIRYVRVTLTAQRKTTVTLRSAAAVGNL